MKKVLIFVRVSTFDQSVDRQIEELSEFAKKQDWTIVKIIREVGSGSIAIENRSAISDLKNYINSQRIDKVLVSEISRLGRTTSESLSIVDFMTSKKVSCFEYQRKLETLNDDFTINPIAELILSVLASVAKMEKAQLIARINSGIRTAKNKGVHCGRPLGSCYEPEFFLQKHRHILRSLQNECLSLRKTAKLYKVALGTVVKVKQLAAL